MLRLLYTGLVLLVLTACAGKEAVPEVEEPGPLMAFMLAAQNGESAELDDPLFGRAVRVTHEGAFASANNEDCRRASVLVPGQAVEIVVMCRSGASPNPAWKLAPRIMGASAGQSGL